MQERVIEFNLSRRGLPERNYEKFVVDSDSSKTNQQLDSVRQRMKSILEKNDTINGVNLNFSSSASYNSFIKSLDMISENDYKYWAVEANNIWILDLPKNKGKIS